MPKNLHFDLWTTFKWPLKTRSWPLDLKMTSTYPKMTSGCGTLNRVRGLRFFYLAAYPFNYFELAKNYALWPLNDLQMTLKWYLKTRSRPLDVFGTLNWARGLFFLFAGKNCTLTSKRPPNDLKMTSKDLKLTSGCVWHLKLS